MEATGWVGRAAGGKETFGSQCQHAGCQRSNSTGVVGSRGQGKCLAAIANYVLSPGQQRVGNSGQGGLWQSLLIMLERHGRYGMGRVGKRRQGGDRQSVPTLSKHRVSNRICWIGGRGQGSDWQMVLRMFERPVSNRWERLET